MSWTCYICFGLRATGLKRGLGLSSFTISLLIEICMDAAWDVCLGSMLCLLSFANVALLMHRGIEWQPSQNHRSLPIVYQHMRQLPRCPACRAPFSSRKARPIYNSILFIHKQSNHPTALTVSYHRSIGKAGICNRDHGICCSDYECSMQSRTFRQYGPPKHDYDRR